MRKFHISDILSVTTGRLVSLRHMDGVYDILNYLTGDDLFTHQLPRANRQCLPWLREQFPDLMPDANNRHIGRFIAAMADIAQSDAGKEERSHFIDEMVKELARDLGLPMELEVRPIPSGEYQKINPLEEACSMMGNKNVIAVKL